MRNGLSGELSVSPDRERIARRIVQEILSGGYVNLGIGLPTLAANYLPPQSGILLQAENGMLGIGPYPRSGDEDADLTNGGKETVTEIPGTSFCSASESFAMISGGHLDMTVLGALEVDLCGNLANWMVPGQLVKGMGGAMDLVAGARRVVVAMEHITKTGSPKIVNACSLPITGRRVVDTIITQLALIRVTQSGLVLEELAPGISVADVQRVTEPPLLVPRTPLTMFLPPVAD